MPAVSDSLRPQNYMKASYMIDVAKYFYAHPERYQFAYDLLYDAAWWQYLNSVYHLGTIQKIGVYGSARNGVGFTPGEHPYAIAVYTSLGDYGETVMGEINALCYEYFYQVDEPGQKNYLDYGFTY